MPVRSAGPNPIYSFSKTPSYVGQDSTKIVVYFRACSRGNLRDTDIPKLDTTILDSHVAAELPSQVAAVPFTASIKC